MSKSDHEVTASNFSPIPTGGPLTSLLASAKRLTADAIKNQRNQRGGSQQGGAREWQEQAWDMYDLVGEERFLATTLAGRLAQATLFVGKLDDSGESPEPIDEEDDPHEVREILQVLGKTSAGRAQLLYRLSVNLFVAGEGWLVGVPSYMTDEYDDGEDWDDRGVGVADYDWHMLSVSEVQVNATDGSVTIDIDGGSGEEQVNANPDDLYLIRVWRPHPRRWKEADSPTRASLPVLKELVGLTMHISAQIDSRLAGAGLLIVPQSAQRALSNAAGAQEGDETDQFTEALIEAMTTPINDRASASAIVPLVVTVPDEVADKFKFMDFSKPLDENAMELRDEAIRRLALGQDAPPELLLGTASMNHWGGWLVQEETVSSHIEPPLALICDALTTQFLWPVLLEQGMDEDEVQQYVIWYDVTGLVARPNHGSEALSLHERGVLTDEAVRRETGFDEQDAPVVEKEDLSDDALRSKANDTALQLASAAPSLAADPGLANLAEQIFQMLKSATATETPGDAIEVVGGEPDPESDEPGGMIPDTSDDDAPVGG